MERERGKVGGWEIIKKLSLKVKTTKNEETEGSVELKTNLGHLSKTPFRLTFFTPNRLGPYSQSFISS